MQTQNYDAPQWQAALHQWILRIMITLDFKESDKEMPAPGKTVLVICERNAAFDYAYDSLQIWCIVAYTEDGVDCDPGIPFKELANKLGIKPRELEVILNENESCTLETLLDMKFLWIYEEEYNGVLDYFGYQTEKDETR